MRPWVVTAYPVEVTEVPDDTTRLASRSDLDALVELYSTFEFVGGLTAWQLRAMLRHVLDRHYMIVAEWPGDDARFAGALAITTRTRRYGVLDLLTVVPDHRGAGWSWALVARAQSIGNALGLAGVAALAGSNPMDLDDHLGDDVYVAVDLVPPRRFRGQGRLRAASTAGGSRCTRERRSGSANRATRRVDSRRRSASERVRTGCDRTKAVETAITKTAALDRVRREGQLIEPLPPRDDAMRTCRSSASTLSLDSTAGRSYCIAVPSAAVVIRRRRMETM